MSLRTTFVARKPESAGVLLAPKETTFPLVPVNAVPLRAVAEMVPEPDVAKDAPVPTTMAAVLFVELVRAENAVDPPAYCGMFSVFVPCVHVAAPLDPVVVRVIGRLVKLEALPLAGVPRTGVTNVGDVAKTRDPVPVSSVIAAAKFALRRRCSKQGRNTSSQAGDTSELDRRSRYHLPR